MQGEVGEHSQQSSFPTSGPSLAAWNSGALIQYDRHQDSGQKSFCNPWYGGRYRQCLLILTPQPAFRGTESAIIRGRAAAAKFSRQRTTRKSCSCTSEAP